MYLQDPEVRIRRSRVDAMLLSYLKTEPLAIKSTKVYSRACNKTHTLYSTTFHIIHSRNNTNLQKYLLTVQYML